MVREKKSFSERMKELGIFYLSMLYALIGVAALFLAIGVV